MKAEQAVHAGVLQSPVRDHARRSSNGVQLLGGLKDELHVARQRVAHPRENAGGPQQHGRMGVVPAGVHDARNLRGVGQARLLLHGEGVHIRAQAHRWPHVRPAARAPQQPQDAVAPHAAPDLKPQLLQYPRDELRRPLLAPAQLRVAMDRPAPLHDPIEVPEHLSFDPLMLFHMTSSPPSSRRSSSPREARFPMISIYLITLMRVSALHRPMTGEASIHQRRSSILFSFCALISFAGLSTQTQQAKL